MSANKRSTILDELTSIPETQKPKKSKVTKKNLAKAQTIEAKIRRISKDAKPKKTKQEKLAEFRREQIKENKAIEAQTKALQGDVIKPTGRPELFNQELAEEVCARIASGQSMRSVSRDEDMPSMTTLFKWLRTEPSFTQQYTRATQERAEAFQEDILDISDDGTNDWMETNYGNASFWVTNGEALQRSRLRVDTRKWLMEKMNPKRYGAKVDLTSNGKEMPIALLGGASKDAKLIDDVKTHQKSNEGAENSGNI